MTKADRIAALIACEHNPVKNKEVLEGSNEAQLTALEAHAATGARLKAAASKADAEKVITDLADAHGAAMTHAAGVKAKQQKDEETAGVKAAEGVKILSTEEWLKSAPAEVRTLVEEQTAERNATKSALITQLKAAQSVYSEDALKAMELKELRSIAQLIKVMEPTSYALNGPRIASEGAPKSYMSEPPPDSYRIALGKDKKPAGADGKVN